MEVYIVITVLKFLSVNSKICQFCYFFQPCVNAKHFNLWSIWMVLPFIRKFSHSHALISTLLYTLRRRHRSLQLSLCTGFSSLVLSPVNSVLDFQFCPLNSHNLCGSACVSSQWREHGLETLTRKWAHGYLTCFLFLTWGLSHWFLVSKDYWSLLPDIQCPKNCCSLYLCCSFLNVFGER